MSDGKLWATYVPGPDCLLAKPDRAAADAAAQSHNDKICLWLNGRPWLEEGEYQSYMASVVEWPYSAESHGHHVRSILHVGVDE